MKHAWEKWVRDLEQQAERKGSDLPPVPQGLGAGELLGGRYLIVTRLDAGGVGYVYRAEDTKLNRRVAVKVLQDQFIDHASFRPRFEREARALSALSHPHIVSILDFGTAREKPYLVMELVEGDTLHALLQAGPMPVEVALEVTHQVLLALAYAHEKGLVHRDIKPGNILVQNVSQESFHVQILDFGFAKFLRGEIDIDSLDLSEPGMAFGTPPYMAPEQVSGADADGRTDLYAVGVVLFEMLAGHPPFQGELHEVVKHHLQSAVPHIELHRPDLQDPDAVDAIIARAMAKAQDDRFSSAEDMIQALKEVPEWSAPRVSSPRASLPRVSAPGNEPARTMELTSRLLEQVKLPPSPPQATMELTSKELEPAVETPSPPVDLSDIPDAPAPIRSEPAIRIPTHNRYWLHLVVVLVATGAVVAGYYFLWLKPKAELVANVTAEAEAEAEDPDSDPEPRPEPEEIDPWSRPAVPLLDAVRGQQERGEPVDPAQVRTLMTLGDAHRNDPRPQLLLARINLERDQVRLAVERYRRAWRADPAARLDPQMRGDLARLSDNEEVATRATRLFERIYGEAPP